MSLDFAGKDELIGRIDRAVDGDCATTITDCLRETLCDLMHEEGIRLPGCVFECCGDHYARRLLHQDDARGYTVLAMTWGPGQGTPVHDHAGMWCVESVWHGQIEVVQYELLEHRGKLYRLEPRTTMRAGTGSAGSLIPPHEYHTITNPDREQPAVTMHIYAGEMDRCNIFEPAEKPGWFRRRERRMYLDAA